MTNYVTVGTVASFAIGDAPIDITAPIQAANPGAAPRMLTRLPDVGDIAAFSAVSSVCTHKGCPILTGDGVWGSTDKPIYDAGSFVITCPCHGSKFDVRSGAVVSGPAKTPLQKFDIEIQDGNVFVDASSPNAIQQVDLVGEKSLFPGAGNKYLVDFGAFVVQLYFENNTTLTYTGVHKDDSLGQSETVTIETTALRDSLYMVTWTEADKTTVIHVEDYDNMLIFTNITDPVQGLQKFRGTFKKM
ncbi:Rieske (2Fe-2S) protein [Burkholderia ambifaria]|uniref:Rieske (2Fe-2S) protein n=1 Tax=Burkholderia ambifaria TaxID=152480 RepID=UPI001B8DBF05|nr:Rieske (2Fe-2S) protein [Burkholderia ambifaria]MBR8184183.1 Rieske (2Fe-2S) protein [Burkholderia ambifaria]